MITYASANGERKPHPIIHVDEFTTRDEPLNPNKKLMITRQIRLTRHAVKHTVPDKIINESIRERNRKAAIVSAMNRTTKYQKMCAEIMAYMLETGTRKTKEIAERYGYTPKTVLRPLGMLKDQGLIRTVGKKKGARWVVTEDINAEITGG
jgi:predicted HTH transcriptional regulator